MELERYGYLILIAAIFLNARFFWHRAQPHIAANPELATGYWKLICGFAFWANIPPMIMGVGCLLGEVPSMFHFFRSAVNGGPIVLAFWVIVYAEFLLFGYWAIRWGGAEALIRHPAIINFQTNSIIRMRWIMAGISLLAIAWNTGLLVWLA